MTTGLFETHGSYRYLGKFSSAMASYLWDRMLSGDDGDESESDSEASGDWATRYGRRILFGDGRGFVNCSRYDGIEEAKEALNLWRNDHPGIYADDDEGEPELFDFFGPSDLIPSESRLRPNMSGE